MKKLRVVSRIIMIFAAFLLISSSLSSASQICDDIDKDFLTRHIPFQFERVIAKSFQKSVNMCQIIVSVNGTNAPLYVTANRDAVLTGDIFTNRVSLAKNTIDQIEAKDFKQYEGEISEAVAFTYKPPAPIKGTIYMVTDPDCPYCERAKDPIKRFADENGMEVRVVFYPMPFHPEAKPKAVRGICGKMDYNDYLAARYNGDLCKEGEEKISKAMDIVRKLGISGTPTFVNGNGRRVPGFIPDQLKNLL